MNTNDIVADIDVEISRLQQVKVLLTGANAPVKRRAGRPAKLPPSLGSATSFNPAEFERTPAKRRTMSPEGRARVAAAQKLRWAKLKNADKKAARKAASTPLKKTAAKAASRKTANKRSVVARKAAKTKTETATPTAS